MRETNQQTPDSQHSHSDTLGALSPAGDDTVHSVTDQDRVGELADERFFEPADTEPPTSKPVGHTFNHPDQ